ncbi:alpha/beta fold hydrolase [Rubellimicrobium roseum]|uniref:Alpha/beta hydrolase n=1 Tax=Rubellimicrobium roseum TaxID=687525 RepID=A0A5C4NDI9_9RHOB|nr:alpha/beta hydrolase [Rubellimicrobium roseum]TNC71985.1 alpha/beta hydrolase [Rubellimicrobium roseum]
MIGWAALGLATGGVAVTEVRAARRERAAGAAFPPEGEMLDVDGRRVHVVVRGCGPDLVLIHGASGNARDMTMGLVDRLTDRYRVTVFDRPRLGYTDRARPGLDRVWSREGETPQEQAMLLLAAARQLGLRQPIVMGHSLGGAVALAWALADPEGISAVVDVSGVSMPWPGTLDRIYRINGSIAGGALLPPLLAAFAPQRAADMALAAIFDPDPVPPDYASRIGVGLTLRRGSIRANARQVVCLRVAVLEMSRHYASLSMPVEIVHGEADIIVPPTIHSVPLSRLVPSANLVLLPGVGHMPHHSRPEAVVAAIDRACVRATLRG